MHSSVCFGFSREATSPLCPATRSPSPAARYSFVPPHISIPRSVKLRYASVMQQVKVADVSPSPTTPLPRSESRFRALISSLRSLFLLRSDSLSDRSLLRLLRLKSDDDVLSEAIQSLSVNATQLDAAVSRSASPRPSATMTPSIRNWTDQLLAWCGENDDAIVVRALFFIYRRTRRLLLCSTLLRTLRAPRTSHPRPQIVF